MELSPAAQIAAFSVLAFIAIAGALGMATTMSMFRSGIFLMASFFGVAGLFILLLADLLALLQVMMYIGGMLVMILFMVLFSHDPGGAMMTGMMKLPPLEKFFSLGLGGPPQHDSQDHSQHGGEHGHHEGDGEPHGDEHAAHEQNQQREHGDMEGMSMQEMSMFTPIKKPAAVLALLTGTLLVSLILWRPAWPVVSALPDQNSPERIGELLMGKYMIAFEGAGLLILLGIFGAVYVSRPGRYPDSGEREQLQAAVEQPPAPIQPDAPVPVYSAIAPNSRNEAHEHGEGEEHHG